MARTRELTQAGVHDSTMPRSNGEAAMSEIQEPTIESYERQDLSTTCAFTLLKSTSYAD